MSGAVLLSARRSPVVPRNGAFAHLSVEDLARPVLVQALADAGLSTQDVGELVVANALGGGGNPARIIALYAGLPERVAGLSLDRQCAGGLDAILLGDALIRAGQHKVVIAGGAESYSRRPLRYRTFADGRAPAQYEQARFTPWEDRDPDMAEAADALAGKLGIERTAQDQWAMNSHARAGTTPTSHIVEMEGLNTDPFTRNLTARHCQKAPTVAGSITAANMAVAADGAAFVIIADADWAAERGLYGPQIVRGCTLGGDPELPGLAPVAAIRQVMSDAGIGREELLSVEIMEAFAVQAIACQQGAEFDPSSVNLWGGALARGHPIGASGAILAAQLFHQLGDTPGYGLAAIAAAGGLGTALLLRR